MTLLYRAYLAIAQIPLVFILATKNNLLSYMVGKGYEKLNFIHRSVGKFYRGILSLTLKLTCHRSYSFCVRCLTCDRSMSAPIDLSAHTRLKLIYLPVIKYSKHGVLSTVVVVPWVRAGLVAWIGLTIVALSSIGPIRTRFYNIFLSCHVIGIITFMVAVHFRGSLGAT